jgi:hypothetical protein
MAKHPHRLILEHKKTWRCTLPGCTYFIHLGLAHILPGRTAICWECAEQFTLDEDALKDEMPKCLECRMRARGIPDVDVSTVVTPVSEPEPSSGRQALLDLMNKNARRKTSVFDVPKPTASIIAPVEDEIEVIPEQDHLSECESFIGGECTCR